MTLFFYTILIKKGGQTLYDFTSPYSGNLQNPYYQPMTARQQLMQPQQMPMQPAQPQPQALIRVTGMEGAKAYQMPPNSVVALFDGGDDIFYIKTTDGAGFATIRPFRFSPLDVQPAPQNAEYVTRAEFDQLKEAIFNVKQPVSKPKSKPTTPATEQEHF